MLQPDAPLTVPYVSANAGGSGPTPIAARGNGINAQRRKRLLIGISANEADGQKLGVDEESKKREKEGPSYAIFHD